MLNFIAHLVLYSLFFSSQIPNTSLAPKNANNTKLGPQIINEKKLGVKITAPYAVAIDIGSGKVLYEKEKDLQTPLASITKLVSAMVFLENNPGWDKKITIEKGDISDGGQILLSPGDTILVKDVFSLSLITSSNEAMNALARSTGLEEKQFVQKMNQKAKSLGLEYTYFIEPTGLEPANISTAYETAIIAKEAFSRKEIQDAVKMKTYTAALLHPKKRVVGKSTDKLLDSFVNDKEYQYEIVGAKTGYITESSYNFAAQVKKDGHDIVIVILGSQTDNARWVDSKGLIDWVYTNYLWP